MIDASRVAAGAAVGLLVSLAVGCSGGSSGSAGRASVSPAPRASDAACNRALGSLPATVLGKPRTPIDVAGTASWGEPAIVLRCGLPAATPTVLPCLSVNGTDWVVDTDHDPFLFTSYGRSPAVELRVPASYGREGAVAALTDVSAVSRLLPSDGHACVGAGDATATG